MINVAAPVSITDCPPAYTGQLYEISPMVTVITAPGRSFRQLDVLMGVEMGTSTGSATRKTRWAPLLGVTEIVVTGVCVTGIAAGGAVGHSTLAWRQRPRAAQIRTPRLK